MARRLNIVRDHVKDECAKLNMTFMVQRQFVISSFVWSNLCLQNHTDFAQTRVLYLRYGRLLCWTTTDLKQIHFHYLSQQSGLFYHSSTRSPWSWKIPRIWERAMARAPLALHVAIAKEMRTFLTSPSSLPRPWNCNKLIIDSQSQHVISDLSHSFWKVLTFPLSE